MRGGDVGGGEFVTGVRGLDCLCMMAVVYCETRLRQVTGISAMGYCRHYGNRRFYAVNRGRLHCCPVFYCGRSRKLDAI